MLSQLIVPIIVAKEEGVKKFSGDNNMNSFKLSISLENNVRMVEYAELIQRFGKLTAIESQLIARNQHLMKVFYIRELNQVRFAGSSINFCKNNFNNFVNSLPSKINTLGIVIVKKNQLDINGMTTSKLFRVNGVKIVNWLNFLKRNNPIYADIVIDMNELNQLADNQGRELSDIDLLQSDGIDIRNIANENNNTVIFCHSVFDHSVF